MAVVGARARHYGRCLQLIRSSFKSRVKLLVGACRGAAEVIQGNSKRWAEA